MLIKYTSFNEGGRKTGVSEVLFMKMAGSTGYMGLFKLPNTLGG